MTKWMRDFFLNRHAWDASRETWGSLSRVCMKCGARQERYTPAHPWVDVENPLPATGCYEGNHDRRA